MPGRFGPDSTRGRPCRHGHAHHSAAVLVAALRAASRPRRSRSRPRRLAASERRRTRSSRAEHRPRSSSSRASRLRSGARATRRARRRTLVVSNRGEADPHAALPRRPGTRDDDGGNNDDAGRRRSRRQRRRVDADGRRPASQVGNWPAGLYFARLEAAGRPDRLRAVRRPAARARREPGRGRAADAHVAGVQPPRRRPGRQAATPGTATGSDHTVRLGRPFLNRGVPYHFRRYDLPFLHWLARSGRDVDVLTDEDLDEASERRRARRRVRPDRLPRPPRVRDDARVRRRSSATATSAATSRSCRRTTSSGRS